MVWLKLTRTDDKDIHVQMDHILAVVPFEFQGREVATLITLGHTSEGGGRNITVRETKDEIMGKLRQTGANVLG